MELPPHEQPMTSPGMQSPDAVVTGMGADVLVGGGVVVLLV